MKSIKSVWSQSKKKTVKIIKAKEFGGPKSMSLDLIRFYVGLYLFYKGLTFMFFPKLLAYWIESGQLLVLETLAAHYVVLAHVFGGLLLLLGLATRFAAIIQVPILLGAVYYVHIKESGMIVSQNMELTLVILFLLLMIIYTGPAKCSLDAYIEKENSK